MRSRCRVRFFACLLIAAPTFGQRLTGELRLEVKDPSGAALQATARLENLATGADQGVQTDAQGKYTFSNLTYGRYRLHVSKAQFATQSVSLDVRSAAPISRTIVLSLGLGITLLVTVIEIDGNLGRQFSNELPAKAPSFYFLDIPADQSERFGVFLRKQAPSGKL